MASEASETLDGWVVVLDNSESTEAGSKLPGLAPSPPLGSKLPGLAPSAR